jgi:hypothetical protein
MSDRIHVATRKGLLTVDRKRAGGWEVTDLSFVGNPVTIMLNDSRDGTLYAGLNLGHFGVKFQRRDSGSDDWQECPAPSFPQVASAEIDATPSGPSVGQLWCLEPGNADQPGTIWAGSRRTGRSGGTRSSSA